MPSEQTWRGKNLTLASRRKGGFVTGQRKQALARQKLAEHVLAVTGQAQVSQVEWDRLMAMWQLAYKCGYHTGQKAARREQART